MRPLDEDQDLSETLSLERTAIANSLANTKARAEFAKVLTPEVFSTVLHQDAWHLILQAHERDEPPDLYEAVDRLSRAHDRTQVILSLAGGDNPIHDRVSATSLANEIKRCAAIRLRQKVAQSLLNQNGSPSTYSEQIARINQLENASRPSRLADASTPAGQFVTLPIPQPPSLLGKRLLVAGAAGIMHGKPGTGKTWIALELARSIARGEDFFGLPTQQAQVGFIELELDGFETQARLNALGIGQHPADLSHFHVVTRHTLRGVVDLLADEKGIHELREYIERNQLQLLVIDALRRAHTGDEKDSQDMGKILLPLDVVRQETGCAILLIHHDRKGQSGAKAADVEDGDEMSGSGALASFPTFQVRIKKGAHSKMIVFVKTSCGLEPKPIHYRLDEESGLPHVVDAPEAVMEGNRAKILAAVLDSAGPSSSDEIAKATKVSPATARRHLAILEEEKLIDSYGAGKGTRYIRPATDSAQSAQSEW